LKNIVIATRGSQLALWQAEFIKTKLESKHPVKVTFNIIKTKGDKILDTPLAKIGGKGLFVKEIENALLDSTADIAVHSMKDVPMELPKGLILYSTPKREEPFDAFLSVKYSSINDLPENAVVGTSSLRRKLQLLSIRPDLIIKDLRGNINTRMNKLEAGEYDGIILAKAGVVRLNIMHLVKETLKDDIMIPACCQGTLGIEIRENDEEMKELLEFLNDEETSIRTKAERAFLRALEGGCQVPIAGYSTIDKDIISMKVMLSSLDGKIIIKDEQSSDIKDAEQLGISLADSLIKKGGKEILKEIYN
jgi:hydroxymethylbilane synthase